ncbi:unnamed protein product [Lampetra planeri]
MMPRARSSFPMLQQMTAGTPLSATTFRGFCCCASMRIVLTGDCRAVRYHPGCDAAVHTLVLCGNRSS